VHTRNARQQQQPNGFNQEVSTTITGPAAYLLRVYVCDCSNTNLAVKVGEDPNIFGVSDGVRTFFNTGLLVALITTIVASLTWRVIASSFVNFLVLIIWLAFLERGQGSTLGLQNFFNEKYSDSHPLTFENIQTAKNNLQGFIDGRLFLVLVIVFLIRWLT
jgi:Silicon transporter